MIHVIRRRGVASRLSGLTAALTLVGLLLATASSGEDAPPKQKIFGTPEAAFSALMAAIDAHDQQAKLDILGHDHSDLIVQSDVEAVREADRRIFARYEEHSEVVKVDDRAAHLIIGDLGWPFPISVVREGRSWRFDTADGKQEIINRRVGRNELAIIELFGAYGDAQIDYASEDRDGDEVREYAQRIVSSEGTNDGLYWPVAADSDEPMSPFGPLVAAASEYLRGKDTSSPYRGYFLQVLAGQGANPPGGAYDYVINGNMIAGFGLIAYPADYGTSGVMTFVVNHQGKIQQKDLGEKTAKVAGRIDAYDPDETWTWVQEVRDPLE
jgi:hypothetical protein